MGDYSGVTGTDIPYAELSGLGVIMKQVSVIST